MRRARAEGDPIRPVRVVVVSCLGPRDLLASPEKNSV
jgi:hypothetical protein